MRKNETPTTTPDWMIETLPFIPPVNAADQIELGMMECLLIKYSE